MSESFDHSVLKTSSMFRIERQFQQILCHFVRKTASSANSNGAHDPSTPHQPRLLLSRDIFET